MRWDPDQYQQYADERSRPFGDLLARVGATMPRRVVDLGCGPGSLTATLARRWPDAVVEGIDSSEEMIGRARPLNEGTLTFRVEDVATWEMPDDADVVVSNAALQWVPGHQDLVARWARALPGNGWLAFQVPGNFDSPSHTLMRELAESSAWSGQLGGVLRHHDTVAPAERYAALLLDAGLAVDAWETTYVHLLIGPDPVLEWVRGTGLRPVLAALGPGRSADFERDYAAALREAYPPGPHGTLFPFRRIFAVGHRD